MNALASISLSGLRLAATTWLCATVVLASACQPAKVTDQSKSAQAPPSGVRAQTGVDGRASPAPTMVEPIGPLGAARTSPVPGSPASPILPQREGAIRIGLLLPLTGADAAIGQSMLRAAQLAVFDIADENFLLLPYDTNGAPEGAIAAAGAAIADKVQLLLGPLFSGSVKAVRPLAREAGVNVVAFSNNRAVAGAGTFLIGLLPRQQIQRVVAFARERGVLRFAALVPNTEFGKQAVDDLRAAAVSVGGVLSRVEYYSDDGSNVTQAVRHLGRYEARLAAMERRKELEEAEAEVTAEVLAELDSLEGIDDVGFDALLVPASGSRLKEIAALLPYYDIDTTTVRLLGMASWRSPGLGREPPLVGAWFATPYTEAQEDFDKRYRELYRSQPHVLAPLAYDATALAAVLSLAEGGPNFGIDALTTPSGFAGTVGIFRFLPTGEAQRGLAVMEIEPWSFAVRSPSPGNFADMTN